MWPSQTYAPLRDLTIVGIGHLDHVGPVCNHLDEVVCGVEDAGGGSQSDISCPTRISIQRNGLAVSAPQVNDLIRCKPGDVVQIIRSGSALGSDADNTVKGGQKQDTAGDVDLSDADFRTEHSCSPRRTG